MNVASLLPDVHGRLRRIRVNEYHRMIEAGILGEDEHVQLVDGMLVAMSPQGPPHAFVIQELSRLLIRSLPDSFKVRVQLSLTLGDDSEPEPDLAVVDARDAGSRARHPTTALLVIEVAGESLRFDRASKAALYARAGVREYWIVNLADSMIEVYREPEAGGYRETLAFPRGQVVAAGDLPGLRVDVSVLFSEP